MPSVRLLPGADIVRIENIFCIGRNYARHIEELGSARGETPVVFLKPTSSLLLEPGPLALPAWSSNVQHEIELVLLVGVGGRDIPEAEAFGHVLGYGVGLDVTARDTQDALKRDGLPWMLAKGFDGAACLSSFVPAARVPDPGSLAFTLHVNGELRQSGDTARMLFPVPRLISYLSGIATLQRGDLVFTGTPEGVAALARGDHLSLRLQDLVHAEFRVA